MRAPSDKRDTDEIVAEIVKLADCSHQQVKEWIERTVQRLISDLRAVPESFSGNQRKNVEFAEELRDGITKLKRTLIGAPNPLILSVLFEERFSQIWWNERASPIAINANTKRYIAEEHTNQKHFIDKLDRLRAQCDEIIREKPGEHGLTKHQHAQAAWASFVILRDVANYTGKIDLRDDAYHTKLGLGCAPTSIFVKIARLFHEAATDEYGADLTRACMTIKEELDVKT